MEEQRKSLSEIESCINSDSPPENNQQYEVFDARASLLQLKTMLSKVLETQPSTSIMESPDETRDPQDQPMYCIVKWAEHAHKHIHSFGYQLSNQTIGIWFNDNTKLLLMPNEKDLHYIQRNGEELTMSLEDYPSKYKMKVAFLLNFKRYMKKHLKAAAFEAQEIIPFSKTPHIFQWIRSTSSVTMHLNDGTVQINFKDHTKLIMCPSKATITFMDVDGSFRTFKFESIEKNGYIAGMHEKMCYAYCKVHLLLLF